MQAFTTLSGAAAPLPMINVDTDMIIPKQFLKTIKRSGLGKSLFFEMRYDDEGREIPEFVLNRPPFRDAKMLITFDNFGCGSSREHAPWALLDFGIRCIVAPSFADIFFNNCSKNGLLLIVLPRGQVEAVTATAERHPGVPFTVDLPNQTIEPPDGAQIAFPIDSFRKTCLLGALDDIGLTLQKSAQIATFEARQQAESPWLYA